MDGGDESAQRAAHIDHLGRLGKVQSQGDGHYQAAHTQIHRSRVARLYRGGGVRGKEVVRQGGQQGVFHRLNGGDGIRTYCDAFRLVISNQSIVGLFFIEFNVRLK